MRQDRPEEDYAFEVVGHLLGVEVEPYDCDGRQGVVDALLHYPDDRDDAVLEVSSIGDQEEANIRGLLERERYRTIPGLTKAWIVNVPADFTRKELDELLGPMLRRCEVHGVDRFPSQVLVRDECCRTLWSRGVTANVLETSTTTPRAYVGVRPRGGRLGEGVGPLVEELFDCLQQPKMTGKIRKLAKPLEDGRRRDERHLFLIVRRSAFSFPVYDALAWGGALPQSPPRLPDGVSQVWLATEIAAGGIVRAVAGNGWLRDAAWASLLHRPPL